MAWPRPEHTRFPGSRGSGGFEPRYLKYCIIVIGLLGAEPSSARRNLAKHFCKKHELNAGLGRERRG